MRRKTERNVIRNAACIACFWGLYNFCFLTKCLVTWYALKYFREDKKGLRGDKWVCVRNGLQKGFFIKNFKAFQLFSRIPLNNLLASAIFWSLSYAISTFLHSTNWLIAVNFFYKNVFTQLNNELVLKLLNFTKRFSFAYAVFLCDLLHLFWRLLMT